MPYLPALTRQAGGINSIESCRALIKALKSIKLDDAKQEVSEAKRLSAGLAAAGMAFLLIWVILCVLRLRVVRRRLPRLLVDIFSAVMAGTAAVLFAISASKSARQREYDFFDLPREILANSSGVNTPIDLSVYLREIPENFPRRCILAYQRTTLGYKPQDIPFFVKAMKIISSAAPKRESAIHALSIVLAVVSAGLILASAVSGVLAVCVKAPPEDDSYRAPTAH